MPLTCRLSRYQVVVPCVAVEEVVTINVISAPGRRRRFRLRQTARGFCVGQHKRELAMSGNP